MTIYGQITAAKKTYDVYFAQDINNQDAKFSLGGTYWAIKRAKTDDGRNSFTIKGKTYGVVNEDPAKSAAKVKIGSTQYAIDLITAQASSSSAAPQPSSSSAQPSSSSAQPATSSSSSGMASSSSAAKPTSTQPGPTNTGPQTSVTMTPFSGSTTINIPGAIIENKIITSTLKIMADNVTIRNCKITTSGPYAISVVVGKNCLIEHCELSGVASCSILGSNYTARFNNVHHSAGDGFKPGDNCVIDSNWVHHLGWQSPGAHADGVQIIAGSNVVIVNNYFDLDITVPDTHSNSSLMIEKASTNVQFVGNYCRGGNYILNGDASASCLCKGNFFYRNSARYGFFHVALMVWGANSFEDGTPCKASDK